MYNDLITLCPIKKDIKICKTNTLFIYLYLWARWRQAGRQAGVSLVRWTRDAKSRDGGEITHTRKNIYNPSARVWVPRWWIGGRGECLPGAPRRTGRAERSGWGERFAALIGEDISFLLLFHWFRLRYREEGRVHFPEASKTQILYGLVVSVSE